MKLSFGKPTTTTAPAAKATPASEAETDSSPPSVSTPGRVFATPKPAASPQPVKAATTLSFKKAPSISEKTSEPETATVGANAAANDISAGLDDLSLLDTEEILSGPAANPATTASPLTILQFCAESYSPEAPREYLDKALPILEDNLKSPQITSAIENVYKFLIQRPELEQVIMPEDVHILTKALCLSTGKAIEASADRKRKRGANAQKASERESQVEDAFSDFDF